MRRVCWVLALAAAVIVLVPPAYLVVRALGAGGPAWASLFSSRTAALLARTAGLSLAVTGLAMAVALPLAWLTARTDLPGRRFWAVATALPLVIPSYIGAYLLVAALGPRGMLQAGLERAFGVERLPSIYGFPGALLALVLFTYPYPLLLVRAALARIDPALEAASRTLGHGPLATFRRVTLPQLRPALSAGGLLAGLYVLRDFGAVSVMRYDTFTRAIYLQYKSAFDRSAAALLALLLIALTLAVLALEKRFERPARYHATGGQAGRRPPVVRLGRWRWPAALYCAGVASLGLGLPAVVLAYWLARGLVAGQSVHRLPAAAWGSMTASGLAAIVALALALPIALLAVRRPGRATRWLDRVTWIGQAVPGLVIALAFVFVSVRFAPAVYQTLALLVIAYAVLFLPQALRAVHTSLLQVQPSVEEAARTLGRGPGRVFASITLPLVAPGVAAGLALVGLTALKELPATLILSPIGFETLAIQVWSAVSEAFYARAAAPALALILLSSLPLAVLVLRDRVEAA